MSIVKNDLIRLLEISSVTGHEQDISQFVEGEIKKRCTSTTGIEIIRIGDSIVVLGPQDPIRQTLCMAGHLDTVPGKWFNGAVIESADRIIGLGASDMKGGVAIMLALLSPDTFRCAQYNLVQIYYTGEEGGHAKNALLKILPQISRLKAVDLCIVLEPTNGEVHLGCMGVLDATIRFIGKAAHSARPWFGDNAIYKALPFIERVRGILPKQVLLAGLTYTEVLSITMAHGGDATNVVPGRFDLNLNVRFSAATTLAEAKARVLELVAGEGEIEFSGTLEGAAPVRDNLIAHEFIQRFDLKVAPKQAYTDVGLFSAAGIAALNFGPGLTEQCHKVDEYILIADLERDFARMQEFVRDGKPL